MSYRFAADESIPAATRRIAAEQIDSALEEIETESRDEAVHQARKRLKKLRALLRLVRPALGDDTYRSENRIFRDAGRRLATMREADVAIETALRLRDDSESLAPTLEELRATLVGCRDHHVDNHVDLDEVFASVTADLRAARHRLPHWTFRKKGFDAMAAGLKRSYRRGRHARDAAAGEPSAERFHEWRKRVKYHRYHLRLLRDPWPPVLNVWRDELHELSDLLGDEHDLFELAERVAGGDAERVADAEARAAVLDAIAGRRAELQRRALRLGARTHAEKKKALVRRIGAYWKAWREESS